jgi:hypothetical protein
MVKPKFTTITRGKMTESKLTYFMRGVNDRIFTLQGVIEKIILHGVNQNSSTL